ncbi:LacI family DNA-binding transcriptional regulator [Microbacterium sp. W1N]|uniref:LacI family DNA-binding transcriptional regulator n=1 Tax=Microbacterium festucae TaxID=2977531 RepID=UPI0021BFA08E|nr:LacI family DNA-binding transcriptional regulator [Microbacterium festucae]MCT9819435.1 LacI family DNA-binding transcriptional regulator [Microbacterium festucae]
MTTRRATIADVARAAGVSASTASVVFSGKTPVSDATRARVVAAATTLGYTGPHPLAASLRRGRSGIVGVVFTEHLGRAFQDPVKILMMDGLTAAVGPLGSGLLLVRDTVDTDAAAPTLTTSPIDAAVLVGCTARQRAALAPVKARGVPLVVIEGDAGDDVPRIDLDNREAQRLAAEHLRALGHTRVATVTLPVGGRPRGVLTADQQIVVDVTRHRLAGVHDVFPGAAAIATAGSSIDEGLIAGRALLAGPDRPTAILAQSDLLAVGVIRAAEEAGLRVPADLSVTGFDGIAVDGLAPYRLTTLVQDAIGKGRAAGDAVAALLAGTPVASVVLPCPFRLGNTTGPVPEIAL